MRARSPPDPVLVTARRRRHLRPRPLQQNRQHHAGAYLAGTNTRRVRRALAALFGGAVGHRKPGLAQGARIGVLQAHRPILQGDRLRGRTARARAAAERGRAATAVNIRSRTGGFRTCSTRALLAGRQTTSCGAGPCSARTGICKLERCKYRITDRALRSVDGDENPRDSGEIEIPLRVTGIGLIGRCEVSGITCLGWNKGDLPNSGSWRRIA
jgi:hypothetical protein